MSAAKFPTGQVVFTEGAKDVLHCEDIQAALSLHISGDWGEVDEHEHDRQENELSLLEDFRLFSVYHDRSAVKFWIITEADRSATTILLPSEY